MIFISMRYNPYTREILKSTTEFRKWVIAHELGYFHEDTLYIMGQYLGKGSYDKAMDELVKKLKKIWKR